MTRVIQPFAVLNPGLATGPVLVLDEPLSFWGGFDPKDGRILDRLHPQAGAVVTGSVLVLPRTRGSAGTPAALAESLRRGVGPVAIVLSEPDVNLAVGAMVADRLYGTATPVVVASVEETAGLATGERVAIEG